MTCWCCSYLAPELLTDKNTRKRIITILGWVYAVEHKVFHNFLETAFPLISVHYPCHSRLGGASVFTCFKVLSVLCMGDRDDNFPEKVSFLSSHRSLKNIPNLQRCTNTKQESKESGNFKLSDRQKISLSHIA